MQAQTCDTSLDKVDYSLLSPAEQEKILRLQQDILTAVARGGDPVEIVNEVCKLEEHLLPNSVASVMLMDAESKHLNVFAAPNVPAAGIEQLNGLVPGPGAGSCGNVLYRREPVFVGNTLTDPRWQDLRHLAQNFNICACWSMPIYSGGQDKIIGTFALSSFENRMPSPFHRKLLEIGASIVGIVLERSKALEHLRIFETALEGSEEGFMMTDANQRIILVNPAFTRHTGYSAEETLGKKPAFLASGQHDTEFYRSMWESLDNLGHWHGEIYNRRKNGEVFPEWLSISAVKDKHDKLTHYIGIFSDISDQKTAEAKIQFLSTHDALTGLTNRQQFRDRVDFALSLNEHSHTPLALLSIDVDHFKLLNESLGHYTGDAVLHELANRLQSCVPDTSQLSRPGGDEFLMALTDVSDTNQLTRTLMQILEKTAQPINIGGQSLNLSCSIGVAIFPDDGKDFETLLKNADAAMYHAKDAGRNTYRFFTQHMNDRVNEHMRVAHSMPAALENNEFVLHYQPQFDLRSGKLIGAEALIRWNDPREGLVPPGRFIPIAEQSGFILKLGEWVLQEACQQAVKWQKAGLPPMLMAVNLSALQFRRGDIAELVARVLKQSGLMPELLELEITESVLMHDSEFMLEQIQCLKKIGVTLAIDDFGTGYSSLAYLKKFKVDRLKNDQSFVRDMTTDPDDAAIVSAVIQMAHALNLRTIAEGVENLELLQLLRDYQCQEAQGFYFTKPLPAEVFFANYRQPNHTAG